MAKLQTARLTRAGLSQRDNRHQPLLDARSADLDPGFTVAWVMIPDRVPSHFRTKDLRMPVRNADKVTQPKPPPACPTRLTSRTATPAGMGSRS